MATYYLFGEQAVKAYEDGLDSVLDTEFSIHCFDPETDPAGSEMLYAFSGWSDYVSILEEDYTKLAKIDCLPDGYWDIIEKFYPDYSTSNLVLLSNQLSKLINEPDQMDEHERTQLKSEYENPRISMRLIDQKLFEDALEEQKNRYPIICPKCSQGDKVTLSDHQSLSTCHSDEQANEIEYALETEVYATAKCWRCEHTMEVQGQIKW